MTYPPGYWCTSDARCTETNHSVNCPKWRARDVVPESHVSGGDRG